MVFRMPFYVYILLCDDGSLYTGHTKNIDARWALHAKGKGARYTRMHKPERVAYVELFDSRAKAMKREREIKKMTRQQKLDLINSRKPDECRV
jgi:putative endonuclease